MLNELERQRLAYKVDYIKRQIDQVNASLEEVWTGLRTLEVTINDLTVVDERFLERMKDLEGSNEDV